MSNLIDKTIQGHYLISNFKADRIQVCIGIMSPIYYENLIDVKKDFQQYDFIDGEIYYTDKYIKYRNEKHFRTKDNIVIISGDSISFRLDSRLTNQIYTGVVEYVEQLGFVVIVDGKKFELKKLLNITFNAK